MNDEKILMELAHYKSQRASLECELYEVYESITELIGKIRNEHGNKSVFNAFGHNSEGRGG